MKKLLVSCSGKIVFGWLLKVLLFFPVMAGDGTNCNVHGILESTPVICGVAQQGGVLYGETDGWEVYIGDKNVSMNGVFVIGLDRDAPDTLRLKFCKQKNCMDYAYPIEQRKYGERKVTVSNDFIEYPPEIEKRIKRETAEVKAARAAALKDTALYFMDLEIPKGMENKKSDVYGLASVYNKKVKSWHKGEDFKSKSGDSVYSAGKGKVILAASHYMNGNIVIVSHGHGITSHYLHLSKIKAKVGDTVDKNTILGLVGSTGQSSGPHLHFQINWEQTPVDPSLVLGIGQNVRD
ncbi:MAG: M23 family metallopeptidase [Alphaproteobacteria bacterium]|nr:M23 family metallopeptidase [Alphaproteobacteria bacterium]